uniref:BED-type domain-containing protein n=1 Tax=Oreochromis aureus TaxID=47969 RepID=A0AAZ1Y5W9_OREAU
MVRARSSVVWGFFENIDFRSVRCLLCGRHLLKKGCGSTTPMLRHLRVKHPSELSTRSNGPGSKPGPEEDQHHQAEGEQFCSVEVALEGDEDDTAVHTTGISSSLNDVLPQLVESGGVSNLWRHLSSKHPKVYSELVSTQQHPPTSLNSSQDSNTNPETDEAFWGTEKSDAPVEVLSKDRDSETVTLVNETDNSLAINGILDASHGNPAEPQTNTEGSDDLPARRPQRSTIWRHFERLDSLNAARCRICTKKLKCGKHGSTNLHRHMSKRHPNLLSELVSNGLHLPALNSSHVSHANNKTSEQRQAPGALKMSEGERRTLKREIELIEALRRTQKEEARTLEHQRELLEKLRAASAREAAAEREQIESLRKAQQEEAKDLSRQREELQKEKEELQKKWDELQQEREELLLFSRGQQVS